MNSQRLRETKEKVKFFKKACEYDNFFNSADLGEIELGKSIKEKLEIYMSLLNKYRNDPDFFIFGAAFYNGGYFAPDDYLLGMNNPLRNDEEFARIIFNISRDGSTIQYFNHDMRFYKEACTEAIMADQFGFPLLTKEKPIIRKIYNYTEEHSDELILNNEIVQDKNLAIQTLKKFAKYLREYEVDDCEINNYMLDKYVGNHEIINNLGHHEDKIKKLLINS